VGVKTVDVSEVFGLEVRDSVATVRLTLDEALTL
jgi:hypothetical protein